MNRGTTRVWRENPPSERTIMRFPVTAGSRPCLLAPLGFSGMLGRRSDLCTRRTRLPPCPGSLDRPLCVCSPSSQWQ